MDWRQILETLIGDVSKALFIAIAVGFLIGNLFRSYVVVHPFLRKMVEYFGNVSVASPRKPTTNAPERQEVRL